MTRIARKSAGEQYGAPVFGSYEELLAQTWMPWSWLREYQAWRLTRLAAQAGRHILCEKPWRRLQPKA